MGNYLYGRDLESEWNEQKYLVIHDFLNKDDKSDLRVLIDHLEQHPLCNKVDRMNNHSVVNIGRKQALLFSDNWKTETQKEADTLNGYFEYVTMNIHPIIMPKIKKLLNLIKLNKFRILRMTIHYIPPGEPEQAIHHDGHPCDDIFYLSIPLHDTTKEMGSTVIFNDKYVKQYRKEFKPKTTHFYNQVGALCDMKESKMKSDFMKARNNTPWKYGDCVFYRDITFHNGAANKSSKVRKYLHIFISKATTRWVDFFKVNNKGVFMENSFQEMMGANSRVIKSIR